MVLKALAAQTGEVVTPHGASAANVLGLTQQVPIREVYLTSGRTRTRKLGRSEVMVMHVPRWMLALGTGPAGAAARALAWMGPTHIGESLATLHRTLPASEWRALASARAVLPSWMAQAIGEEAVRGKGCVGGLGPRGLVRLTAGRRPDVQGRDIPVQGLQDHGCSPSISDDQGAVPARLACAKPIFRSPACGPHRICRLLRCGGRQQTPAARPARWPATGRALQASATLCAARR